VNKLKPMEIIELEWGQLLYASNMVR